eukprot:5877667-Amphidinium_carterae.2
MDDSSMNTRCRSSMDLCKRIYSNSAKQRKKPHDVFAATVWALIRIGYDTNKLAEFLTLLQNLPFSTRSVEQAYGSSAVIHRYHPSLGLDRHLQRSFLHQVRFLFLPDTSKHESLLVSKLQKLMAKRITANTARTQFFKEAVQDARLKVGPNAHISHESMQKVMAMHAARFCFQTILPPGSPRVAEESEIAARTQNGRTCGVCI